MTGSKSERCSGPTCVVLFLSIAQEIFEIVFMVLKNKDENSEDDTKLIIGITCVAVLFVGDILW